VRQRSNPGRTVEIACNDLDGAQAEEIKRTLLEITAQEQARRRQFIGFLYESERNEAKRLTAAA